MMTMTNMTATDFYQQTKELIDTSWQTPEIEKEKFIDFLMQNQDKYHARNNMNGHVTASMFVLNEQASEVLLTHHKKLSKWLQLGGHWDNNNEGSLETAIREMLEEGFGENPVWIDILLDKKPLDLDIHLVGDHLHYDLCFLVRVKNGSEIVCSSESHELKWESLTNITTEAGFDDRMVRMAQKTLAIEIKNDEKKVFELASIDEHDTIQLLSDLEPASFNQNNDWNNAEKKKIKP
jgi:8-oxo-dGTP pyrophosphatase MutT (NUDIX family)